uniref:Guanylate cyclase domain-containing protein n=3 Tax=Hemiselmis andersenii TaxID=464988 RepID=A0A7S0U9N4_HEMAN|mmetsp:Transcript_4783/g.11290  ORF Transcript_4783/g.11290 Transcript_4783/m.11290 type:complete len:657 (+) Transcript_4783:3-1973(+)
MVLGVLALVVWHRVSGEYTRRKLWASRQHAVEWRANMSRILCDMLPRQYSQALVMGIIKSKTTKAVASAAITQPACVLFSDLVGFTALSEKLAAKDLVDIMHHIWSCFDALVQKYGMHKIDTVGDAFIVIALVKDDSLETVANEMLTLAKWMVVTLADVSTVAGQPLGIRIGIDTGPIVTGIIGTLQRRFHAHGQVVSNAQRLEGLCPHGGVLVSQAIAEQCKADFPHLDRSLNHYDVGGRKVSLARSKSGKQTNKNSQANARTLTRAQSKANAMDKKASFANEKKGTSIDHLSNDKRNSSLSALVGTTDASLNGSSDNESRRSSASVRARFSKVKNAIGAVAFMRTESGTPHPEEDALETLFRAENPENSNSRRRRGDPEDDDEREKDLLRLAAKREFDSSAKDLLQKVNNAGTEKKMTGAMRISLVPVSVDLKDAPAGQSPKTGGSTPMAAPKAPMVKKARNEVDPEKEAKSVSETTVQAEVVQEAVKEAEIGEETKEDRKMEVNSEEGVKEQTVSSEVLQEPVLAQKGPDESMLERLETAETTEFGDLNIKDIEATEAQDAQTSDVAEKAGAENELGRLSSTEVLLAELKDANGAGGDVAETTEEGETQVEDAAGASGMEEGEAPVEGAEDDASKGVKEPSVVGDDIKVDDIQ